MRKIMIKRANYYTYDTITYDMPSYKCRAENNFDISELINLLADFIEPATIEFCSSQKYKSELKFKSALTFEQMLEKFLYADRCIGDLHVMVETVQYENSYTGVRRHVGALYDGDYDTSSGDSSEDLEEDMDSSDDSTTESSESSSEQYCY
jgi:hypothetical protein